jgi:excisionase family DNA binding protein
VSALRALDPELMRAAMTVESVRGRPTITVPEAAELLGIGRNAAYEAAHRGEIETLKFGTRLVVPVAPLLRLLGIEGER